MLSVECFFLPHKMNRYSVVRWYSLWRLEPRVSSSLFHLLRPNFFHKFPICLLAFIMCTICSVWCGTHWLSVVHLLMYAKFDEVFENMMFKCISCIGMRIFTFHMFVLVFGLFSTVTYIAVVNHTLPIAHVWIFQKKCQTNAHTHFWMR